MPFTARVQGTIRWIILGLTVLAFIFVCVSVGHCSFTGVNGTLGLYTFENSNDRCERYDKDADFNSGEKAGRAFGAMAAVFVAFNMVLVFSITMCLNFQDEKRTNMLWLVARVLYIVTFICNLIMFSAFDGCDGNCELGAASIVAILNIFVLLPLIVLSWLVPPPTHPFLLVRKYDEGPANNKQPQTASRQAASNNPVEVEYPQQQQSQDVQGDTVKITVVDRPNGERVTTKEVTHADGSKTITETVEQMEPEVGADVRQNHVGKYGEA